MPLRSRPTILARYALHLSICGLLAHAPVASAAPPTPRLSANDAPMATLTLTRGRGQLVSLPAAISDIMIADPQVADVQVRSPRQIYLLAKALGQTTIFALSGNGRVVYAASVNVSADVRQLQDTLSLALPGSSIVLTQTNSLMLMTGTVASATDAEQAEKIVKAASDTPVINRLKAAAPVQVNLQVRIAEVNRQVVKNLGINLLSRDTTGGFLFGVAQGRSFGSIGDGDLSAFPKLDASALYKLPAGSVSLPFNLQTGKFILGNGTEYNLDALGQNKGTNIALAGKFLGLDLASAIDLAENEGLAATLAQPNLTAVSGQTASFLAGGEVPLPVVGSQGQSGVEFKEYGVSLSFTPTVLSDGRISMRVRPEVSQLSQAGAVKVNGFAFPGISTRRVETTVELGSGQSFMIGGLMQNSSSSSIDRAPGLGNLPILGALFRSTEYRKNQTELVVIVTPYLVKPVSERDIHLPTDGLRSPSDPELLLLGRNGAAASDRPMPSLAAPPAAQPNREKSTKARLPSPGFGK